MPPNRRLLPTVPPFAKETDVNVMAWQIRNHAEAIEHLNEKKIDIPAASVLRLIGVTISLILGLTGLVSPVQFANLLRLLLP